jgi:hypothetical protein
MTIWYHPKLIVKAIMSKSIEMLGLVLRIPRPPLSDIHQRDIINLIARTDNVDMMRIVLDHGIKLHDTAIVLPANYGSTNMLKFLLSQYDDSIMPSLASAAIGPVNANHT